MSVIPQASKLSTGFTPTSIPGCSLWLDAADSSSLTLSGSSVTQWKDKSGNNRTITLNGVNSYTTNVSVNTSRANLGYFSANLDIRKSAAPYFTIFIVYNWAGYGNNVNQCLWSEAVGGSFNRFHTLSFPGYTVVEYALSYSGTSTVLAVPSMNTGNKLLYCANMAVGVTNGTYVTINGTSSSLVTETSISSTGTSINFGIIDNNNDRIGDINFNEIIIYVSTTFGITTNQRQQIEGYLARKWGLTSNLPNTHPFKLTPLYTQPFSPLDISGLQLWLDAADNNTLALAGSTLAGWIDKSGTGKAITINSAPSYSATGFNSKYPCFTFTTSNYLSTTLTSSVSGNDCIVAVVWKNTSTNTANNVVTFGTAGTGSDMGLGWNNNQTMYKFYQYGSGEGQNTSVGNNTNCVLVGTRISGTMGCFANGNTPSAAAGSVDNTQTALYIGTNVAGWGFAGQLCEVIIYVGAVGNITTTQRQQLEGYLAKKWGLQGSIVSTHPFKLYPPLTTVFNPLQIPSCQLWLDALDSSTLTLSGSNVTQWRDKSGNGYTASPTTATKTSSNSVLIGSSGLTFANYSWRTRYTAFFVSKGGVYAIVNYRPAQNYLIYVYTPNWSLSVVYSPSGGTIEMNDSAIAQGTSVVDVNAISLLTIGYNNGSTATPYAINGTARSTTRTAGTTANDGYLNGSLVLNNVSSTELFEVLFYNDNLTTAQYQQIEGYLAQKWGLRTLPSTHPYKMFSTPFVPSQISGLSLWLDASDSASLTLSGSNVTQWKDKSGNGYNATASAGSGPTQTNTINGLTCLSSSNNKYLTISNFNQNFSQASVFWVIKPTEDITPNNKTADGYPQYIVINGSTSGYIQSGIVYSNPTQTSTTDYFQSYLNKAGTGLLYGNLGGSSRSSYNPLNQVLLESFILNGLASTNEVYNNGTSLTKVSVDGTFPSLSGITINIAGSPNRAYGYSFGYDVAEILIFNSALTTAQRQQVEGYLAWKWGLTASLPSGHPYKSIKP